MAGASAKLGFEETELRLGLPNTSNTNPNGKRGFDEFHRCRHHHDVDLKLNLCNSKEIITKSDTDLMISHDEKEKIPSMDQKNFVPGSNDISAKPPAKAQVIGWPPVRSFRKNILAVQKSSMEEESEKINGNGAFVKVSMDGAPYLRKVDLKMYKSYQDLSHALANMFSSSTIGKCGPQGMKDFMNESKLMDLLSGSDYVPTYEDKDGDWMLIGDVPWEMFVKSCKRLRIMKGKEAIGLAPRAMEKCRNRN